MKTITIQVPDDCEIKIEKKSDAIQELQDCLNNIQKDLKDFGDYYERELFMYENKIDFSLPIIF